MSAEMWHVADAVKVRKILDGYTLPTHLVAALRSVAIEWLIDHDCDLSMYPVDKAPSVTETRRRFTVYYSCPQDRTVQASSDDLDDVLIRAVFAVASKLGIMCPNCGIALEGGES